MVDASREDTATPDTAPEEVPETTEMATETATPTPTPTATPTPTPTATPTPTPTPAPTADGARSSANIFFLGHSLLGWDVPTLVEQFAAAQGLTFSFDIAIGIGANLAWQWGHPERAQGDNPRTNLGAQPYDVLVLTEAIPIVNQLRYADSVENALNFMELAHAQNPNVQVYLYETWEHRENNRWRSEIPAMRAHYDQILDGVNARFAGRDMLIIPGGQAMGALVDRIRAGGVPGIQNEGALFSDNIHLTSLGWYFISCVHYATIYQRTPVGVPVDLLNRFEQPFEGPSARAAAIMQQIAWDVVSGDPRSGISR